MSKYIFYNFEACQFLDCCTPLKFSWSLKKPKYNITFILSSVNFIKIMIWVIVDRCCNIDQMTIELIVISNNILQSNQFPAFFVHLHRWFYKLSGSPWRSNPQAMLKTSKIAKIKCQKVEIQLVPFTLSPIYYNRTPLVLVSPHTAAGQGAFGSNNSI